MKSETGVILVIAIILFCVTCGISYNIGWNSGNEIGFKEGSRDGHQSESSRWERTAENKPYLIQSRYGIGIYKVELFHKEEAR